MVEINIQQFEPDDMLKKGRSVMVIGSRATGKTVVMKSLVKALGIEEGTVVSRSGKEWEEVFRMESLDFAVDHLKRRFKMLQKHGDELSDLEKGIDWSSYLVLDDIIQGASGKEKNVISEMIMNGRFYKISLIMSSQVDELTPAQRCNVDWVMIGGTRDVVQRRRLFNHYGMSVGINTLETWNQVMDVCTQNYGFLVIDCTGSTQGRMIPYWYHVEGEVEKNEVEKDDGREIIKEDDGELEELPKEQEAVGVDRGLEEWLVDVWRGWAIMWGCWPSAGI